MVPPFLDRGDVGNVMDDGSEVRLRWKHEVVVSLSSTSSNEPMRSPGCRRVACGGAVVRVVGDTIFDLAARRRGRASIFRPASSSRPSPPSAAAPPQLRLDVPQLQRSGPQICDVAGVGGCSRVALGLARLDGGLARVGLDLTRVGLDVGGLGGFKGLGGARQSRKRFSTDLCPGSYLTSVSFASKTSLRPPPASYVSRAWSGTLSFVEYNSSSVGRFKAVPGMAKRT